MPASGAVLGAAALLVVTGVVHSWLGERHLIGPILRRRRDPAADHPLGRLVLRFGWHMMLVAFALLGLVLAGFVLWPGSVEVVTLLSIGIALTLAGVFDAVASRGRHVGWPLLLGAGVLALAALA